MDKRKAAYIFVLIFLACTLFACPKVTKDKHNDPSSAPSKLSKLNIYLYKDNPSKTQPEQIASIDNENSLRTWNSTFEEKGKETLPAKAIKGMFLYEKVPATQEKAMQRKCFILVMFEDDSAYYKEFPLSEKFEIQNYTKQSGEELIKILGRDNWGKKPSEEGDHEIWLKEQLKKGV